MSEVFEIADELGPAKVIHVHNPALDLQGILVVQAADVAAQHLGFGLRGARVAIQGFGAVGKHAARFLVERGAVLVAASDSGGTIHDPRGLDLVALLLLKETGAPVCDYAGGQKLGRDAIIDVECEVWIPAARPDVVHEGNVPRLRTRLVVQGANIPLTTGAERILHEKGDLLRAPVT